jgi:RHS repeat-associated protein
VIGSTGTIHYDYSPNGNRLGRTTALGTEAGTYDEQDRLITYAGRSYTYTPRGALESVTEDNETTTYQYDAVGGLRQVVKPDNVTIAYEVDGAGRRVWKSRNGTRVQGFVYADALRPAAELDGSGNVVARFIYGRHVNVPDLMIKNGRTYRIVTDHLGSVRFVVDTASGNIVQAMTYDEYGRVLSDSAPGFQPFGYAGGLYDTDTGLVRFGARDYDAFTGRWTAKDPIGFAGGDANLYAYVGGEPINRADARGNWVQVFVLLLSAAEAVALEKAIVSTVVVAGGAIAGILLAERVKESIYRIPRPIPFPDFAECKYPIRYAAANCCGRLCGWHPEFDFEGGVCTGDERKSQDQECFEACMEAAGH